MKSKKIKLDRLRTIIAEGSVAGCYDPEGNRRPYWPNRCDICPDHSDAVCPPKRKIKQSKLKEEVKDNPMTKRSLSLIDVNLIDDPLLDTEVERDDLDNIAQSLKMWGESYFSIYVRRLSNGRYQLIHHKSLLKGVRQAGLKKIWAEVLDFDDKRTIIAILSTSPSKKPLEEARGIQILMEKFGMRDEDIASETGKGLKWVQDRITLLQSSDMVKTVVKDEVIPLELALEIAKANYDKQEEIIEKVRDRSISIEEVRAYVHAASEPIKNALFNEVMRIIKDILPVTELEVEWLPGILKTDHNGNEVPCEIDLTTLMVRCYRVQPNLDVVCEDLTHESLEYLLKQEDRAAYSLVNKLIMQTFKELKLDQTASDVLNSLIQSVGDAIYSMRERFVNILTRIIAPVVKQRALKEAQDSKEVKNL